MKQFTTARVRAILGFSDVMTYTVNNQPLDSRDRKSLNDMLNSADISHHFISHYYSAVGVIDQYYNYDLRNEKPLKGKSRR